MGIWWLRRDVLSGYQHVFPDWGSCIEHRFMSVWIGAAIVQIFTESCVVQYSACLQSIERDRFERRATKYALYREIVGWVLETNTSRTFHSDDTLFDFELQRRSNFDMSSLSGHHYGYDAVMLLFRFITSIFFREIRSRGAFNIPLDGPVIFVGAPHGNQVLEFPQ